MQWKIPSIIWKLKFDARRTLLFRNYRSSPQLVRIQHVLAKALDTDAIAPNSQRIGTIDGDVCRVWRFSRPDIEAEQLADFVAKSIEEDSLHPNDFVIIVRQKASDYASRLTPMFSARGLSLRNEAAVIGSVALQDLLTEEASKFLILLLRIAASSRAGGHWNECIDALISLRGHDTEDEIAQRVMASEVQDFISRFQSNYPNPVRQERLAREIVETVHGFIGRDRLIADNHSYRQGDWPRQSDGSISDPFIQ